MHNERELWHHFFKFAVLIKIQSHMTEMMKSPIVLIYQELSVIQFSKQMEAVVLA